MGQLLRSRFFQFVLLIAAFPSLAYMGPGAGLTAFGCLVALLAGIWYTCKGFLWLPLKRRFSKNSPEQKQQADGEQQSQDNQALDKQPQAKKSS